MPKCAGCGLLAKRPTDIPDRASPSPMLYVEVEQPERESGDITDMRALKIGFLAQRPCHLVCMVGVVDLWGERAESTNTQILKADRPECQSEFFRYVRGLSPEKHVELRVMERLEQSRRDFEVMLHRESQDTQAGIRRVAGWQLVLSIVAIVIGVVASIAINRFTTAEFTYSGPPLPVVVQQSTALAQPPPTDIVMTLTPSPEPSTPAPTVAD